MGLPSVWNSAGVQDMSMSRVLLALAIGVSLFFFTVVADVAASPHREWTRT